jgi:hypothetical protein
VKSPVDDTDDDDVEEDSDDADDDALEDDTDDDELGALEEDGEGRSPSPRSAAMYASSVPSL